MLRRTLVLLVATATLAAAGPVFVPPPIDQICVDGTQTPPHVEVDGPCGGYVVVEFKEDGGAYWLIVCLFPRGGHDPWECFTIRVTYSSPYPARSPLP